MTKDVQKKVEKAKESKEDIEIDALAPLASKEAALAEQRRKLEEKLAQLAESEKTIKKEKETLETELKKLPPIVAKGIKDIQEYDKQIKDLTAKRAEQARNLKQEMLNLKVKEEFINKLLGTRGFGKATSTGTGTGKPRITPEEKQAKIVEAIKEGNDTITKIYSAVGMSQNTRDNLKALIDSGKIVRNEATGKYSLA